jgi:hypothetical protein
MADNDKVEVQDENSVDETIDGVEGEGSSEESETSSQEGSDDAEGSEKKKSNWKAMSKLVKALRKENAELKSGKSEDSSEGTGSVDKADLALFFVENPDAREHKAAVLKAMKDYDGITLEKAWKFVRAVEPKESQTKKSVDFRPTAANPGKDISKLSPEEALKLPNSQYLKWARANGK